MTTTPPPREGSSADDASIAPLRGAGGTRGLFVTLLGRYAIRRDRAVASGTFIEVLGRCGVKEHAARSLIARMVRRGWLERFRRGRRTYLRLSPSMAARLDRGRQRIYEIDPVMRDWAGEWTLLTFSIPESRRADRHRLRSRLAWDGFGPARNGLWIAPGRRSIEGVFGDLDLHGHLTAFEATLRDRSADHRLVRQAWDLEEVVHSYRGFLSRWAEPLGGTGDPLARHLHLIADWRRLLREAPILPVEVVPPDWPAAEAWARFHALDRSLGPAAAAVYADLEDAIEIADEGPAPPTLQAVPSRTSADGGEASP